MKAALRLLFLGVIILGGCRTAHDVAVTSFRVIDAPRQFVRRQMDQSEDTTTTTTTTSTVDSDAVTPGHPVDPSREAQRRRVASQPNPATTPGASSRVTRNTTADKPKPSPTAARSTTSSQPNQLPTAKTVPGKPGYVFSPFDPSGGYVDVTGYASGSKVKDPYSGKIFLVP